MYIIQDVKTANTAEYEEMLNILTEALKGRRAFCWARKSFNGDMMSQKFDFFVIYHFCIKPDSVADP
jgi:hypothetical protein